jgi:hypothetical protein
VRSGLPVLVLSITALAAAGCGNGNGGSENKTVDSSKVEQGIKDDLSGTSGQVASAKCPDDVKSEKGATFNCSVKFANGSTGKVEVTQTDTTTFSYDLVPGSVHVPGAAAEKEIQKDLAQQGVQNATVNCPDDIVVKSGTTVTCDVSGAKGAGKVTFTFSREDGTVDPSSVKAS